MYDLRRKLAQHGFESNDDYSHAVTCLLGYRADRLRCLNVVGDPGRRKTAFATALAGALEYPQVIYHDFTQEQDPPPVVVIPERDDESGAKESPVPALDRAVGDACAHSEGDKTILILDQLQAADFREHIRLYHFVTGAEWRYREASFYANPRNLLLFLVSEEPVYHSLQKHSFRLWVSGSSLGSRSYRPGDFGLRPDAGPMMSALDTIFEQLGVRPTHTEYARILNDVQHHVRTADELAQSIFGWTEGIERELLLCRELRERLAVVMPIIETYLGVDQVTLDAAHVADPGEPL